MIFTARQLEDLHKAHGQVALPRGARLTPLAQDWLKSRKIVVAYSDIGEAPKPTAAAIGISQSEIRNPQSAMSYLYWCDGPCGMAKAALSAYRDVALTPLPAAADAGKTLSVVKDIAGALKSNSATGAILFVQSSASAMVFLNRCPSVRAVLGTSLQTVDMAVRALAANVLVVEYQTQTLQQMKNLIGRFVRARRELSPEAQAALKELASCG